MNNKSKRALLWGKRVKRGNSAMAQRGYAVYILNRARSSIERGSYQTARLFIERARESNFNARVNGWKLP